MTRFSPRARIVVGLTAVLGILVGSTVLEYFTMRKVVATTRTIREAQENRAHLRSAMSTINEGMANSRAFSQTRDPAFFAARAANTDELVARMRALAVGMTSANATDEMLHLAQRLRSAGDAFREHAAEHLSSGPVAETPTHAAEVIGPSLAALHEMQLHEANRERRSEQLAERLTDRAVAIAIVGATFAIAVTMLFGFFFQLDVRKRMRAEAALQASEAQFRTVVGVLTEGVIFMDHNARVMGCNRAATAILGLEPEQIMAPGETTWHGGRGDGISGANGEHPALQTLQSGDAHRGVTWGITRPDGQRRWLMINSEPVLNEDGRMTGVVSSFTDITERRDAERKLREANDALWAARDMAEYANRAKSEFLAHMSHELRTPLNSVIGFANVLRSNKLGNLMPDQLKYLERVHDNGRHLLDLVNDVLDLSKVEAGHMDLAVEDVALGPLVCQTLAQLEGQVKGKRVELKAELDGNVQALRADRRKLRQVLINLLGNALKFTESGSVTVRVVSSDDGRPVRLDVIDTGIGIPLDRQQAVFEAFKQADTTTTRQYGGTGLGLTITRSLLHLMGYHVTLESEPGKGSTFSVHFHAQQTGPESTGEHEVPSARAA